MRNRTFHHLLRPHTMPTKFASNECGEIFASPLLPLHGSNEWGTAQRYKNTYKNTQDDS